MALSEEQLDERWRVPTRDEMRQLLEKYFVGPVSEEFVDLIETRFLAGREDRAAWASYFSHFESMTRWNGKAWYEDAEFTFNRRQMTPRHLVVMIANKIADRNHDGSVPQPKLYCPPMFVGSWQQIEPTVGLSEPCLWHLSADGTFRTNNPNISPEVTYWCAARLSPDDDQYALILRRGPTESAGWSLQGLTAPVNDELIGRQYLPSGIVQYRFRRVQG